MKRTEKTTVEFILHEDDVAEAVALWINTLDPDAKVLWHQINFGVNGEFGVEAYYSYTLPKKDN